MNDPSASNLPGKPRNGGKAETEGGGFLHWLSGLLRGGGDADLRESIEEVIDEHGSATPALNP